VLLSLGPAMGPTVNLPMIVVPSLAEKAALGTEGAAAPTSSRTIGCDATLLFQVCEDREQGYMTTLGRRRCRSGFWLAQVALAACSCFLLSWRAGLRRRVGG
jgi:hypothetical protein